MLLPRHWDNPKAAGPVDSNPSAMELNGHAKWCCCLANDSKRRLGLSMPRYLDGVAPTLNTNYARPWQCTKTIVGLSMPLSLDWQVQTCCAQGYAMATPWDCLHAHLVDGPVYMPMSHASAGPSCTCTTSPAYNLDVCASIGRTKSMCFVLCNTI